MKKFYLLTKTLLVAVCLLVGVSNAWAVATTYDFEDDNVRFSAYNSSKITVAIQENSGPNGDSKAVKFAYKAKGNHNFAYLDFSSLVVDASTVNVAFDFYVTTASGHDLISLADADYHTGANAGFDSNSNTGYGSNGAIFNLGCYRANSTNDFAINSNKKTALTSTCLGHWCHADITVDNVGKTVSYTITRCDDTALDAAASATGVSFMNGSAVKCTQIDVYMGATSSGNPIYIDNLVITPTVIATNHSYVIKAVSGGTTLKTFAAGMVAEGSTYSSYVPKVINNGGSYYVLSDANLSNFNASYTMSTANVIKEIAYTLDESIVYYVEGESLITSGWVDNSNLSNGRGGRGLNNSTKDVYTIPTSGKYTITSAVCNNNINSARTFSFYKNNSDNVLQTYTGDYPSVSQVMTTGTRTSDVVELSTDDVIKFYAGDTQITLDYVIIRKAPVTYTVNYECGGIEIKTADASRTAVWGTKVSLTDADKDNIIYNNATYQYSSDNASSTVIAADGASVITVNFTQVPFCTQTNVTGAETWDWTKTTSETAYIELTNETTPVKDTEFVLKNVELYGKAGSAYSVPTDFGDAQKLSVKGQYPFRYTSSKGMFQGNTVKFTTEVPGILTVDFSRTGSGTARTLYVNGEPTSFTTATTDVVNATGIVVQAGDVEITGNEGGALAYLRIYKITFTPVTSVSATIGANGYATFCSEYPLDFTSVSNATAWVATECDGSTVTMEQVEGSIYQGKGLVLKSNSGAEAEVTIPVVASSTNYYDDNKLVACLEETTVTPSGTGTNYVLSVQDEKVVFAPVTSADADDNPTVAAGHAYLYIPSGSPARVISMVFGDEILTDINEAVAATQAAQKEGKFIVDGKLVIFKKGMKFNANGQMVK